MKLTPWMLTVAVFVIIALLAVGFLFKKLLAREEVAPPKVESRTLPMALTDIEPGMVITSRNVGLGPWTDVDSLSPDTFTNADSVVGRIAKERIPRATPLKGSDFYSPGQFPSLDVGANMRAVTVELGDDTSILNGRIQANDYVDVHMTVNASGTPAALRPPDVEDAMTLTLFEGVRVLAVNDPYGRQTGSDENNITLELDKEQARIMLLAREKGQIALTFNPNGRGNGGVRGQENSDRITLDELLGIAPPAQPKKPFMTEQYREGFRGAAYFLDGRRVGSGANGDSDQQGTPVHSNSDNWQTETSKPGRADRNTTQKTAAAASL